MRLEEAPVVGSIGPRPDGLDAPYWDGLVEGRLRIQQCDKCERWIWGPQWACPQCLRVEPGWVEIEPSGRVYSWTRTWQKFAPEFSPLVPYVTVLVELPHAGDRRLLGLLVGDDSLDPRIGEEVRGVFQNPSEITSNAAVLRWERRDQ